MDQGASMVIETQCKTRRPFRTAAFWNIAVISLGSLSLRSIYNCSQPDLHHHKTDLLLSFQLSERSHESRGIFPTLGKRRVGMLS